MLLVSEEQNLVSRVLMIGMGLFEVNLSFVHKLVIVLAGDLRTARTAQMSHKFPLLRSKGKR